MLGFIELFPRGGGRGLLPYISQIAMCNLRQALPISFLLLSLSSLHCRRILWAASTA